MFEKGPHLNCSVIISCGSKCLTKSECLTKKTEDGIHDTSYLFMQNHFACMLSVLCDPLIVVLKYVVWSKPVGCRMLQAQWNIQIESQQGLPTTSEVPLWWITLAQISHAVEALETNQTPQTSAGLFFSREHLIFLFSLQAIFNTKFHFPAM